MHQRYHSFPTATTQSERNKVREAIKKLNQKGCNNGLASRGSTCTYFQESLAPERMRLNDNVACGGLKGREEQDRVQQ